MTYQQLVQELQEAAFTRIERDDRLLDTFSKETREKGVELWEKIDGEELLLVRVRLPYASKNLRLYRLPVMQIEQWLTANETRELEGQYIVATGEGITEQFS